jgi:hypothetical protein
MGQIVGESGSGSIGEEYPSKWRVLSMQAASRMNDFIRLLLSLNNSISFILKILHF